MRIKVNEETNGLPASPSTMQKLEFGEFENWEMIFSSDRFEEFSDFVLSIRDFDESDDFEEACPLQLTYLRNLGKFARCSYLIEEISSCQSIDLSYE